jgi:DNA-binding LytR/AlgR family response regulator
VRGARHDPPAGAVFAVRREEEPMLATSFDESEPSRGAQKKERRAASAAPAPALPLLIAHRRGKRRILHLDEIVWIQAAGNYVRVHTREGAHLVRVPMHALDAALAARGFLRVHRSALVPAREMFELIVEAGGATTLVLRTGARLPVSRDFRRRLDAVSLRERPAGEESAPRPADAD